MFEKIIEKEKYFIQPFIDGEKAIIKISMDGNFIKIKQFNKNNKKVHLLKKLEKNLEKCYQSSKFFGYDIILKGFIVRNYKKVKSLLLYDIMTNDEYEQKNQSKKYSVRLENLNVRFLTTEVKHIKSIFSHPFNENNLQIVYNQFIKTNIIDGYTFHKNIPYKYDDEEVIIERNICKKYEAKIIDFIFGNIVKQKIDENENKIESKESIPCLDGIKIKFNNKEIIIDLNNILDSEKIKYFNEVNELKEKMCEFKEYNFLNNHDYIFVNFK